MKILSSSQTNGVAVLKLENDMPATRWTKLRIDGDEYDPCIVMDAGFDVIAIRSGKDFTGKDVEFVDGEGSVR